MIMNSVIILKKFSTCTYNMDSGIVLQVTASNISIQANLPVTFGILPNELGVS